MITSVKRRALVLCKKRIILSLKNLGSLFGEIICLLKDPKLVVWKKLAQRASSKREEDVLDDSQSRRKTCEVSVAHFA